MKVPWSFFSKRRGYDLSKMLEGGTFKTYADYAGWCEGKGVDPIGEAEFNRLLPKPSLPKPPVKSKRKPKPPTKPKPTSITPKSVTRKRKSVPKNENPVGTQRGGKSGDGKD